MTKEKVKKIFNSLDDGINELLIYEIDVKDIMSISNIHDKPIKLYNDLVKKAKKWRKKYREEEEEDIKNKEYIQKFKNIYQKFGYDVGEHEEWLLTSLRISAYPLCSTASYGNPICFKCGLPIRHLNKCGSEYFCDKCLKE